MAYSFISVPFPLKRHPVQSEHPGGVNRAEQGFDACS
jgi:hypothetical protein